MIISILLFLLKSIGILLLSILLLLLFLLLVILLVPIRYRLSGGKDSEGTGLQADVTFLLSLLHIRFALNGPEKGLHILIAGLDLKAIKEKRAVKKEAAAKKKAEKTKNSAQQDLSVKEAQSTEGTEQNPAASEVKSIEGAGQASTADNAQSIEGAGQASTADDAQSIEGAGQASTASDAQSIEGAGQDSTADNAQSIERTEQDPTDREAQNREDDRLLKEIRRESENKPEESSQDQNRTGKEAEEKTEEKSEDKDLSERLDDAVEKIARALQLKKEDLDKSLLKIKALTEKIEEWIAYLTEESMKKTLNRVLRIVFRLIRYILPYKAEGYVEFGLSDPALMGRILGWLGMLYPVFRGNFSFVPYFNQKKIEGNAVLYGRIRIGRIVRDAIRILLDKNVLGIIKKVRSGGKKNGKGSK